MTEEQSREKTQRLDVKIERAIRDYYGYGEEGDEVFEHFMNTIDDAESYFALNAEYREDNMYSHDFNYRNEKD